MRCLVSSLSQSSEVEKVSREGPGGMLIMSQKSTRQGRQERSDDVHGTVGLLGKAYY